MKKIYPGDDFTIKLPDYLGGKSLPTGSSVSMKIFTINQSESYSLTITQNPLPKNIELSSDVLIYMTSGVIQGMLTVNIPDSGMDDSFYNYSRVLTTDLFWVNSNAAGESLEELNNKINALDASVHANYYTMSATDHLLDLLWSDVAASYVDDSELFAAIDAEDASVKSAIAAIPIPDMSDYYTKSQIDSSVSSNYYTMAATNHLLDLLWGDVVAGYVDDSELFAAISAEDTSIWSNLNNYYIKSDIDSSVSTNYYNKTWIDASIGSIQTALNSIIND